jgi:surfeit locus 1 family protein
MNRHAPSLLRRIVPHLAAVVVIALCAKLALWQLDRAAEKDAMLADWEDAPAMALHDDETVLPGRYARITAEGEFDTRRHVLLDNQLRNMHPGVHVFTPFRPRGSERVWMVNRGWQPMPQRDSMPEFDTPGGAIQVSGRLSDPPRVGLEIGRAAELDAGQWPNLMTYFDLDRIRDVLGDEVEGAVILLDPDHPAHLSGDDWQPVTFGPERHRAYAFQWFTLAAVVLIIWLTLTFRSFRRP